MKLSEAQRRDAPFWSDDFDMDLPKIFPRAKEIMGDLADIRLVASGRADANGRLNHPSVWNSERTMLSFFGFADVPLRQPGLFYKPAFYSAKGEVFCTAWEAFRDAWPHQYLIQIERRPIWDTFPLWRHFEAIMWHVRGWDADDAGRAAKAETAKRAVMKSYSKAVIAFRDLVHDRAPAGLRALQGGKDG